MGRISFVLAASLIPAASHGQVSAASFQRPFKVIDSIPAPESVALGPDGAWYVSSFGKFGVKGDGAVYRVDPDKGTLVLYAGGLDDPCGLLFLGKTLWAADREGGAKDFPRPLHFLNDLAAGPGNTFYVSDTVRAQSSANGLFHGGGDSLYAVGYRTGILSVTDGHGAWREIATLGSPDGIAAGRGDGFYVTDNVGGILFWVPRDSKARPIKLAADLKAPADLIVDDKRGLLVVPENAGNRLSVYRLDHNNP